MRAKSDDDRDDRDHRGGEEEVPVLDVGGDVGGDADREGAHRGVGHQGQRDDVLVPGRDEGEDGGGHDAGPRHRQDDAERTPARAAAVDRGGLLDLARDRGEEGAQDPDREGEVEGRVDQDQRGVGVDQAQLEELAVEPDHQRGRREHLGHQDQEQERAAAREAVARGVVRGGHRGRDHEGGRGSPPPPARPGARTGTRDRAAPSRSSAAATPPAEPRRGDAQLGLGLERGEQHHRVGGEQRRRHQHAEAAQRRPADQTGSSRHRDTRR